MFLFFKKNTLVFIISFFTLFNLFPHETFSAVQTCMEEDDDDPGTPPVLVGGDCIVDFINNQLENDADNTLNLEPGTYELSESPDQINTSLLIQSTTNDASDVTVSGQDSFQIFNIGVGGEVIIDDITIQNGFSNDCGGAINNNGILTISGSIVRDNNSTSGGGAICNETIDQAQQAFLNIEFSAIMNNSTGEDVNAGANGINGGAIQNRGLDNGNNFTPANLSILTSILSQNTAFEGNGGSIDNIDGGIVELLDVIIGGLNQSDGNSTPNLAGAIQSQEGSLFIGFSTIANNQADADGGIFWIASDNQNAQLIIINSTISNNTSNLGSGGVNFSGGNNPAIINNVTIAFNNAMNGDGGGLFSSDDSLTLSNSIISNNSAQNNPDCSGDITSLGFNLIQNETGCIIAGQPADLMSDILGQDPLLEALANNHPIPEVITPTHALMEGSLALAAGNPDLPGSGGNSCEEFDQRAVMRPQGMACDIGAFELFGDEGNGVLTPGDVDGDGMIQNDINDLILMINAFFGIGNPTGNFDCNNDGDSVVINDIADLICQINAFFGL